MLAVLVPYSTSPDWMTILPQKAPLVSRIPVSWAVVVNESPMRMG